jgi:hypothetical protein
MSIHVWLVNESRPFEIKKKNKKLKTFIKAFLFLRQYTRIL